MSLKATQWFMFEECSDWRWPFDPCRAWYGQRPLSRSWGEVMPPPPPLMLFWFQAIFYSPHSAFFSPSSPWWSSQQLEDIRWCGATQVLPGLLSSCVPQLHVGFELTNQQPHYILVPMDSSDVERRVAACWPGIYVEGQTGLFNSIPESPESRSMPGCIKCAYLPLMSLKMNVFHKQSKHYSSFDVERSFLKSVFAAQ